MTWDALALVRCSLNIESWVCIQALTKLKEPKVVLKVRKADLSLLKDSLETIKSKYKQVACTLAPSLILQQCTT